MLSCSIAPLKPERCVFHLPAPLYPLLPSVVSPPLLSHAPLSPVLSWLSVQMSALSYLFAKAQSNVLRPVFTSVSTAPLPHPHCSVPLLIPLPPSLSL